MRRAALVVCAFLLAAGAAAKQHAFSSTAHGDKLRGPQRLADRPRGSCVQCHDQHAAHDLGAQRNASGLFAPNDNELCFTCHATPSDSEIFPGSSGWMQSAHATSPRDAAKCVECHDPHGVRDAGGLVPAMLDAREPELCLRCHDGARGADIRLQLTRPFRHGMEARGRHDPAEGGEASKFAAMPGTNRHLSCSDCHNAHRAVKMPSSVSLLAGVSRIEVANGPAGTAPRFTWRGADDPSPGNEYEICFKCHSSWTRLAPGQSDLALLTNPANASFHPIQAPGKNAIDPRAFAGDASPASLVACSDCHEPHAATERGLLTRNDLCFACHALNVYGAAAAAPDVQKASRFNAPSTAGHAFHAGAQRIACEACHDPHGSARHIALIATGRMPGITSFTQTANGGTCASTCHAARTYGVNYGR